MEVRADGFAGDRTPRRSGPPGPPWMWVTAWSFQGLGIIIADRIVAEPGIPRLVATGLLAAVPLLALYLLLGRKRAV
jgi:hypothetical protein